MLSVAEHHSNIVPWQLVAQKTGAVLRFVELTSEETLDLEQLKGFLNERTKLVSLFHVSNTLGMYLDVWHMHNCDVRLHPIFSRLTCF